MRCDANTCISFISFPRRVPRIPTRSLFCHVVSLPRARRTASPVVRLTYAVIFSENLVTRRLTNEQRTYRWNGGEKAGHEIKKEDGDNGRDGNTNDNQKGNSIRIGEDRTEPLRPNVSITGTGNEKKGRREYHRRYRKRDTAAGNRLTVCAQYVGSVPGQDRPYPYRADCAPTQRQERWNNIDI